MKYSCTYKYNHQPVFDRGWLFATSHHEGTMVRDWLLITGRGATTREGGHVKFYPYEKGGGAENVLEMLKWGGGGHTTF